MKGLNKIIVDSVKRLRAGFTFRSCIILLFGVILISANIFLFFAAATYFLDLGNMVIIKLILLAIGQFISCVWIFILTLHCASQPTHERPHTITGSSLLSSALECHDSRCAKKILIAIIVYAVICLAGLGTTGYYFIDRAQYKDYIPVTAEYSVNYRKTDYCYIYTYTVNGITYNTNGNRSSKDRDSFKSRSGTTVIKYDPRSPSNIYLQDEKQFFLIFGSIALFITMLLVAFELANTGFFSLQLFLSVLMLGATGFTILIVASSQYPSGIRDFLSNNPWIFLLLTLGNAGLVLLFEGIVDFKSTRKYGFNEP